MGCGPSKLQSTVEKSPSDLEKEQAKTASRDVDAQLLEERMRELFCFKVLLLGAGESGKSTVVKQLKAIHNSKLSPSEFKTFGDSLHQNVIDCIRALLQACETFGYQLDEESKEIVQQISDHNDGTRIPFELGQAIRKLYDKPEMQKAYERRSEFWLLDACNYYMDNLARFTDIGFEPTEEDVVMARVRTTGIIETLLEEKRQPSPGEPDTLRFQVVDVGGQRNERKKWIHCFDDVKAILFVENLAGYNRVLFEDASKNMMKESLELFHDITHNDAFKNTPIFLFLNKKDLFEKMIRKTSLKVTFPEYEGPNEILPSLEFVTAKFRAQAPADKHIEVQYVTGLWKRDIKCAFEDVKKILLEQNAKIIEAEKRDLTKQQKKLKSKSHWNCSCSCTGCCAACTSH